MYITTQSAQKNGFTLLEMAILILVSGVIMTTTASYFSQYVEKQRFEETKDDVAHATAILSTYATEVYPCPTNRALGVGDPNFGQPIGFDDADGPTEGCKKAFNLLAQNGCSGDGGYCRMQLLPDVAGKDTDKNNDSEEDYIYFGGYPIRFVEGNNVAEAFDLSKAIDGYGNQLSYAVTANMTQYHDIEGDGTADDAPDENWGAITVADEFGNPTGGIDGNAVYVIISHGKDGKGAFSGAGTLVAPCNSAGKTTDFKNLKGADVSVVRKDDLGKAVDADNCDEDDVFRQALGNYEADSATHFDDIIEYNVRNSTLLWQRTMGMDGKVTENMRNLNTGDVGVGGDDKIAPDEKLTVDGTLRAESLIRTSRLCDSSGKCADINNIVGSTGIACPTGQAATKLANGAFVCANVGANPNESGLGISDTTCATGKFITSFNANGSITCN